MNGTVNDLAVSGATPLALSAGFIIEEGFEVAQLRRLAASMARAAEAAGVAVATGDTKVVERGKADGLYVSTAGIGLVPAPSRSARSASGPATACSSPARSAITAWRS